MTQAPGDAIVNIQNSSLSIPRGSIQVGNAGGTIYNSAGNAILIWNNADITGGLAVGNSPANDSATVTLTNSNYNNNGIAITVGTAGDGSYTQNSGTFTVTGAAGLVIGSGINGAKGDVRLENMKAASIDNLIVGANSFLLNGTPVSGTGDMTIKNSQNVQLNGTSFIGGTANGTASGTLTLDDHANLTASSAMLLSYGQGGTGKIDISKNSSLTLNGPTMLGHNGTGIMTIENNGQATFNNNVTIGSNAGSLGTLSLTDNSGLYNTGDLTVGDGGVRERLQPLKTVRLTVPAALL